jgi:hypothetical protein
MVNPLAQGGAAMADEQEPGGDVRQHVREMLARLVALQRKRAQERNPSPGSVDTAVEVEGEDDPPGSVGDPEGPA